MLMKKLWDPIVKSAEDLQAAASRLVDEGVTFFRAQLGSIPLLSSSKAEIGGERDETHYFLIPNPEATGSYTLFRTRVLPDGIGPENELPKARIFQLPAQGTTEHLIHLLSVEIQDQHLQKADPESPLAARLENIADEIDKQSNRVSGGLLLIGGAVAIANPLLGVGIAAKSLLPSLGSKLSVHGVKHASSWLRSRNTKAQNSGAQKSAQSEIKKLKPEVRLNPVTQILERALHSQKNDFDPTLESSELFDTTQQINDISLGAKAILTVFDQQENRSLPKPIQSWVNNLRDWV